MDKVVLTGQKVKKEKFYKKWIISILESIFLPNSNLYFGSSSSSSGKLTDFLNIHHSGNKNF